MTRWRLVLRLARRDVLRRPGRTALVALLVALPVAAMVMAVTVIRTDQTTLADEWARFNGAADARVFSASEPEGLPAGAISRPLHSWWVMLRAVDGPRRSVELHALDGLEPFAPIGPVLVEGRAPRVTGEVTLSRGLARVMQVEVGDELVIDRPSDATLTVVGLAEDPGCLSCHVGHASVETLGALVPGPEGDQAPERWLVDLPPMSIDEQASLVERSQGSVMTRDLFLAGWDPLGEATRGSDDGVRWAYVLGAVALTVVGIVISAAFAVGARRQLVALGQLSASGASPSTLRAALVVQGTVTGLLGAIAGLAIAAAALLGLRGVIEEVLLDRRIPSYDARALEVLGAALVGVVAATVAALIPARTAARVPTLTALAGRRPLPPVPRRLIGWGTAAVLGGLALLGMATVGARSGESGQLWAFVAIVGGVAELLGACAIAPALVARLEPLAARLRGSWRMAARGLARHRTRTGAVVGAVCAAAGLAICASALLQGAEAREPDHLEPSPRAVVASVQTYEDVRLPDGGTFARDEVEPVDEAVAERIQRILPSAQQHVVQEARTERPDDGSMLTWDVPQPGNGQVSSSAGIRATMSMTGEAVVFQSFDRFVVVDATVEEILELSDAERTRLHEVGAALLVRAGGGHETFAVESGRPDADPPRQIPIVTLEVDHTLGSPLAELLVTEAMATDLGLEVSPAATVFVNPARLDARERELVEDLAGDLRWEPSPVEVPDDAGTGDGEGTVAYHDRWLSVTLHHPPSGPTPFQLELALTALALVFCLFVVGTSLALAAAESKDERDVLTVAGAPPGLLARLAGARAWLLAALGGLLAVPVGFLPVIVFTQTVDDEWTQPYPLVFPVRTVVLLVVVVPVVVALVARTTSALAQRARPVRVSTAVFE